MADVDGGARDGEHTGAVRLRETVQEDALVGEDAELVALDDVQTEQVRVEEGRRPGAGHHGTRIDCLHVPHRTGELTVDLGVHQFTHPFGRLLVDHGVPDGAAVLDPVQVDRSMSTQGFEVAGAAVVLVDEA